MTKPTAFIGSSGSARQVARLVGRTLQETVSVDPWATALPQGRTIFESLIAKAQTADFAVFVFGLRTPSSGQTARRICRFETTCSSSGLFLGELGPDRTFAIMQRRGRRPSRGLEGGPGRPSIPRPSSARVL